MQILWRSNATDSALYMDIVPVIEEVSRLREDLL
jgi:hypothetical protein